jgi:hypothetical protein
MGTMIKGILIFVGVIVGIIFLLVGFLIWWLHRYWEL